MNASEHERFRSIVEELAGLGHRGSGTEREREGASLIQSKLDGMGLSSERQPFAGSHAWAARYVPYVVLAALGAAALPWVPWLAAALGLFALLGLVSDQTTLGPLPLFLSPAPSQNVLATISARGERRRTVVLCAHYDSQRTGWLMHPTLQRLLFATSWLPAFARVAFLPVTLGIVVQIAIGLGLLRGLAFPASAAIVATDLVCAVLLADWWRSGFVPGAVDNASGVAAVLVLAERLVRSPIPGLEGRLLFTGCEETGLLGVAAWARTHRAERADLTFLNLDAVGGGPPRYFSSETPVVGPTLPYPRDLVALAGEIASTLPSRPRPIALPGQTDGFALLVRGFRGLTLCGMPTSGGLPNYHLPSDLPDGVDVEGASQGIDFAWAILERLGSRE